MPDGPTQLTDVIVIGTRAVPGAPRGGGPGGGGSVPETPIRTIDLDAPPIEPESVWNEEDAEAENRRQTDCAAKKYNEKVAALGNRGKEVEHFSVTWKKNGETVTSGVREATGRHGDLPVGSAVSSTDFNQLSNEYGGIPLSEISGFNHSHAAEIYCNGSGYQLHRQREDNQRPSTNDWNFADALTDGNLDHGLILYIRDCEGVVRAFPYKDKAGFKDGSIATPPPISPDGCDEAS